MNISVSTMAGIVNCALYAMGKLSEYEAVAMNKDDIMPSCDDLLADMGEDRVLVLHHIIQEEVFHLVPHQDLGSPQVDKLPEGWSFISDYVISEPDNVHMKFTEVGVAITPSGKFGPKVRKIIFWYGDRKFGNYYTTYEIV